MPTDTKGLLLFDGVCNVCNTFVLFVADRDPREHFQFASQQSEFGQRTLARLDLQASPETMVLIEGDRTYVCSAAALQVVKRLRWPWPLLYALVVIPRPWRDAAYRYFASHRYAWFGKSETCRIPTPELKRRMLA